MGLGVTRFRPGDEVFGMPRFPHKAGGYAEHVTAPSRHFTSKPASTTCTPPRCRSPRSPRGRSCTTPRTCARASAC
ncbi:hypothetical protein [Nonomuraea sp. K271]|uniref:hypothetical protein n=1 Tax=Nonomuraea sp. K271 TaxID=1848319 RepID=UPI003FA56958